MSDLLPAERKAWGSSFFCDDIRHELGGKITLVGMYQNEIIFPIKPPVMMPKLAIWVRYQEIKGSFSEDITFKVFFPSENSDEVPWQQTLKRDELNQAKDLVQNWSKDAEIISTANVPIMFSPVQFNQEGLIKVRAFCGETTIRLGTIMVRAVRESDSVLFAPNPAIASPQPSEQSRFGAPAS